MATILVVDDRPTNRQFLMTLLGYGGHRLFEAGDGEEALKILRSEATDLVVTDLLMPTMDGYEFVKRMRTEPALAHLPVIFYSAAYSVAEAQAMAETCGVRSVLAKPSEPQVILDAVDRELGQTSQRSAQPPSAAAVQKSEARRIETSVDAYLTDLKNAKELIDRIVEKGDQLFQDRELLRPLAHRFAENINGLQAVTTRLAALEELSLKLVAERDPEHIVQVFAEAAAHIMGASQAAVCVLGPREESVAHIATRNLDAHAFREIALIRHRLPGSLLEALTPVRHEGPEALLSGWPFDDPGGVLGVPIRTASQLSGWMCFAGKQSGDGFTLDDERVAVAMAAQFAVAYENTVLYETVQRHAVHLQIAMNQREQADLELKESEQRFRQMAENIHEVFFLTDPMATQMYYISPAYEDIWGATCEALYKDARSWAESIVPEDRDRAFGVFAKMETEGRFDLEYRIRRPDGGVRWIRARGFPIRNESGETYRVAGIAEDVTDRKETTENLARSNRALTMLSRCNETLIRAVDEGTLFQDICRIAVEIGGYRVARVGVAMDDENKTVEVRAQAGDSPSFLNRMRFSWAADRPDGVGPASRAIRSGEVLLIEKLTEDAVLRPLAEEIQAAKLGSGVYLPLKDGKRVLGVLVLLSTEGVRLGEDELRLLRELADDLAFGILTIRARAERQRAEEALMASLRDKGALLKEVHHRVKNNLQVITSLLRLEARRVENPGTRIVLRDMQNRVHAMAALHERLYRSNSFAEIELGPYIGQLVEQLVRSVAPNPEKITIQMDVASVLLGLDQAVPCGLLVTELVSNALKHAFPEGRIGTLLIELRSVDEKHLALRVCDDGIGLPEDFETRRKESLGLQLATDLSRQIGGTLEIERGLGTSFQVTFAKTDGDEARRLPSPVA
jgi:PAS domain S-box-containing protein